MKTWYVEAAVYLSLAGPAWAVDSLGSGVAPTLASVAGFTLLYVATRQQSIASRKAELRTPVTAAELHCVAVEWRYALAAQVLGIILVASGGTLALPLVSMGWRLFCPRWRVLWRLAQRQAAWAPVPRRTIEITAAQEWAGEATVYA